MRDLVDMIPGAFMKYSPEAVDVAYDKMAAWARGIIKQSDRPVMLIGPMQGALFALSALARRIREPVCYRQVKVSLYNASNQADGSPRFHLWPIKKKDLGNFHFIVVDDVAESLMTFEAMLRRLNVRGANVYLTTLVDKPTEKRVAGLRPDFSPLTASEDEWLMGEGMDSGGSFEGEAARCVPGIWVKFP